MKATSRVLFAAAIGVFLFFFANVAAGAFLDAAWLSDVAEMYVLVLASVLFVISTLLFERIEETDSENT